MLHIEYQVGVKVLPIYAELEMQMFGSCPTRTPCESNGLTGMNGIATLHQILRLMAIYTLQTIGMADYNQVAISSIRF